MADLFIYDLLDGEYYVFADQNPPFQFDENTFEEEEPEDPGV